jgi:hypothetical protein
VEQSYKSNAKQWVWTREVINMAHCENIPIPNKIIVRNFALPTTLRGCVKPTGNRKMIIARMLMMIPTISNTGAG